MDGLSADKMKVLLHPSYDKKKEKVEDGDDNKLLINNNRLESNHHPSTEFPSFGDSIVLSTMQDSTRGKWKRAQVSFSFLLVFIRVDLTIKTSIYVYLTICIYHILFPLKTTNRCLYPLEGHVLLSSCTQGKS